METLEKTYKIPEGAKPGTIGKITKPPCGCAQALELILSTKTLNAQCGLCGKHMSIDINLKPEVRKIILRLKPPGSEPPPETAGSSTITIARNRPCTGNGWQIQGLADRT